MMDDECCSSSSDSFKEAEAQGEQGTPLSAVSEAFEELTRHLGNGCDTIPLEPLVFACSLVSELFGCLGFAFKFAEIEYVTKVNDLLQISKAFDTLSDVLDHDVKNDSVRKPRSHSRNMRRVRLGLELIKSFFEQFISSDDCSPKEAASSAYAKVCAPYHTWPVRKAVGVGMCTLPTREQLLFKLNDNGKPTPTFVGSKSPKPATAHQSVEREMRRYIVASALVIEYIDKLYLSRDISLDW